MLRVDLSLKLAKIQGYLLLSSPLPFLQLMKNELYVSKDDIVFLPKNFSLSLPKLKNSRSRII